MIHSRFGMPDGVSIVMKQIEQVMISELEIPKENIFYLVGKSGKKDKNIFEHPVLLDSTRLNGTLQKNFQKGFGGNISEKLEKAIFDAQKLIKEFIEKNKIDIIIAHNAGHPVNFVMSVALSRYYRDQLKEKNKTPKYLLWWHDSHLERSHFASPAVDVERYLSEGIPGPYTEYIFFINSMQFKDAERYFKKLDKLKKGFFEEISKNIQNAEENNDKKKIKELTEEFNKVIKDLNKK